jgi:dihydroxy-acid dehydratase
MGTANSMHIACEALGMTLPGAAPILANSPAMFDLARQSGRRIVEMVWEDLTPRRILTPGAFRNAAAAVLAVSGSINCIKHLQATAVEAGLDLDVFGLFNELSAQVPVLSAVAPNGPHTIDEFEAAGGARALLRQLAPLLDRSALTVTGRTLGDDIAGAERAEPGRHPSARPSVLRQGVDRRPARIAGARRAPSSSRGSAAPAS